MQKPTQHDASLSRATEDSEEPQSKRRSQVEISVCFPPVDLCLLPTLCAAFFRYFTLILVLRLLDTYPRNVLDIYAYTCLLVSSYPRRMFPTVQFFETRRPGGRLYDISVGQALSRVVTMILKDSETHSKKKVLFKVFDRLGDSTVLG